MKIRMTVLLLVAVLLLSVFPVHAAEMEPTFVVDTVTASAGDTVEVTIRLENNPGVTSIKLSLEYSDELTFIGASANSDIGNNFLVSPDRKYPVILNWYDGLKNVTGDWVFVTLSFALTKDAAPGTYPVTISYDPNDVFDVEENNVSFSIVNGAVEVVPPTVNVTGVTLNQTAISLTEGESTTLTATVSPANATNKAVTFASSDTSVAIVDAYGKVTAIGAGTATITVTTVDGGKVASCTVMVTCAHSEKTEVPAVNADCVNPGNHQYYICAACGQVFKADGVTKTTVEAETIPATDHSFSEYIEDNNATCVEDGTETATCEHCDETDTRMIVGSREDAEHSFPDRYTSDGNATCTTDGTKSRTCTLCGEKETVTDEGSKLGHQFTHYVSNGDATCTADGTETAQCGRCDATDTRIEEDSAKGHRYGEWYTIIEPTCTAHGQARRDCKYCDNYETDVIASVGHDYVNGTCINCGMPEFEFVLGDVNEDGEIDILDANLVVAWYNEIRELEDDQLQAADVNGDGEVDIMDANMIVAYYNEVIDSFPAKK